MMTVMMIMDVAIAVVVAAADVADVVTVVYNDFVFSLLLPLYFKTILWNNAVMIYFRWLFLILVGEIYSFWQLFFFF